LVACLLLTACGPSAPPLNVVNTTGTNTEADANAQPPSDALRQLATSGINAAVLLGPLLKDMSGLAAAFFDAKAAHPAAYGVLEIPNWEFKNGWYVQRDEDGSRTLNGQFTDAGGTPVTWDVTRAENYDPELHAGFPAELQQVRFQVDRTLPGGGRLALTLFAPLSQDRHTPIEAYGSGSATVPAPLGTVSFESLNATFTAGAEVDHGVIGLKTLVSEEGTLQFSGSFVKAGLEKTAKLLKNGKAVGDVVLADGHWQIVNGKGTFPLQ
jgi:hypothetical protein